MTEKASVVSPRCEHYKMQEQPARKTHSHLCNTNTTVKVVTNISDCIWVLIRRQTMHGILNLMRNPWSGKWYALVGKKNCWLAELHCVGWSVMYLCLYLETNSTLTFNKRSPIIIKDSECRMSPTQGGKWMHGHEQDIYTIPLRLKTVQKRVWEGK